MINTAHMNSGVGR